MVIGAVLAVVGGLAGFWLVGAFQDRTAVLVVARGVEPGATVSSGDLAEADVAVPAGVSAVPASQREALVGKVARAPLYAGSVLAPEAIGDPVPPVPGRSLVVLALPPTRMPAAGLTPGQHLLLVSTGDTTTTTGADTAGSDTGGSDTAGSDLAGSAATGVTGWVVTADADVVRVGEPDSSGMTPVDVSVHAIDGPLWAGKAADGRVAVLVVPQVQR